MSTTSYLCVWFGTPGECQNCGGSTHAEDGEFVDGVWTPTPGGERGPFKPDPRYCSEDCFAEAQMDAERWKRAAADWCPSCGFDRHEHADDCSNRKASVR